MKLYSTSKAAVIDLEKFAGKNLYVHVYLLQNWTGGSTWIRIIDIKFNGEVGTCYFQKWLDDQYGDDEVRKLSLDRIEYDRPIDVRTFDEVAEWYAGGD